MAKRLFVAILTTVIAASNVAADDTQDISKYSHLFSSLNLGDSPSILMYEEAGIFYFFNEDTVYTNIFGFLSDDNIFFGTSQGDEIYIFDSEFSYLGTIQDSEKETDREYHTSNRLLFTEEDVDQEDKGAVGALVDFWKEYMGHDTVNYKTVSENDDEEFDGMYLGRLSANQYDYESVNNPYGPYGNPYSANSINNPYSPYGNPFSPTSATNPYAIDAPRIFAPDGTYLGKLSANKYDYESISNPYGPYGNPYSPTSIKNPYGQYGNPYSPTSVNNPYTLDPPLIFGED